MLLFIKNKKEEYNLISRIARLRAKKGFTIIELIIVISIITILLAMVIPVVSYDRKPAAAKTMCKEFYYRASEVITDCKAANYDLPALPSSAAYICYYGEVDRLGNSGETGYFFIDKNGVATSEQVYNPADVYGIGYKMNELFRNYVTDEVSIDLSGHLIAVVDTHYRVLASYWIENFEKPFAGQGMEAFEEDNILSTGSFCTTYPTYLCTSGNRLFVVNQVLGITSS